MAETDLLVHIKNDQGNYIGPQPGDESESIVLVPSSMSSELAPVTPKAEVVEETAPTNSAEPDTLPIHVGDNALGSHAYLSSIGLHYEKAHLLLICAACGIALNTEHGLSHVRTFHPVFRPNITKEYYYHAVSGLELERALPDISRMHNKAPLAGLPVYDDGLACPWCQKVFRTTGAMDYHHRVEHPRKIKPTQYEVVYTQQLDHQKHKSYFRVCPPLPRLTANATKTKWLDEQEAFVAKAITVNPHKFNDVREVNDFLRLTKWPEYIQDYSPAVLHQLVQLPTNGTLDWLKKAVEYKFLNDLTLIEETPLLILQRLNTSDPAKGGISNDPFHAHQKSGTIHKYIHEVVRLLSFLLLDTSNPYKLPLPTFVKEAIETLRSTAAIPGLPSSSFAPLIQKVLYSLWGTQWRPSAQNPVGDPTMCFVMLSSLKANLSWCHPKDITGLLAKLTYCIRLVVLREIHVGFPDLIQGMNGLQSMYTEKTDSTFNSIRSLQHLATSFALSSVSLPTSFWLDSTYTQLIFKGDRISIAQIQAMGRDMILSTFQFMHHHVFWSKDVFLEYEYIADDLTEQTPGYNIFQDRRNSFLLQRKRTLLQALLDDPTLCDRYILGFQPTTGQPIWNLPRIRLWYKHYCELQLQFMTLIQLLGGAPARGTEIACIQYTNTPNQTRGFFKMNTHWVILCRYTKTSALTGHDKFIPHGIDAFTGDMIFQSLTHALPVAKVFASALYPNSVDVQKLLNTFLFPNDRKISDSDRLSESMRIASQTRVGVALGLADWRQLFVTIKHKHCPDLEDLAALDSTDTVSALQAGHSRQTEDRIYGLTQESFAHHSEDVLQAFLGFSNKWDAFMKVPDGSQMLSCRVLLSPSAYLGHLPKPISALPSAAQEAKRLPLHARLLSQWPAPETEHDALAQLEARCVSALHTLLDNAEATWTSVEQKEAVMAAASGCNDVVAILPTGGGKTMVALIQALIHKSSVTLIVVPFVALLQDYQHRLERYKVAFSVFTSQSQRISGMEPIVLITAEISRTAHFTQCLMEAHHRRVPIQAIVFDEFHTVHTSQHYRESLQHIYTLRAIPTQWILLSGTIPPRSTDIILHNFNLHPKAIVIRSPTNRPELEYVFHQAARTEEDLLQKVSNLYHVALAAFTQDDRALIYVPYKDLGWELASRLKCDFYAGTSETAAEERKAKYQSWIKGENKVMVCTHAFGCGHDYPHVRWICHAGTPYEMINFIQEVGRAGRDSRPAVCELVPKGKTTPSLPEGVIDHAGLLVMHNLVFDSTLCIRFALTEFTDGEGVVCAASDANRPCSRCAPLVPTQPRTSQSKVASSLPSSSAPTHQSHSTISQYTTSQSSSSSFALQSQPTQLSQANKRAGSSLPGPSSSASNVFEVQVDSSKRRRIDTAVETTKYKKRIQEAFAVMDNQCTCCLVLGNLDPIDHKANDCPALGFSNMRKWRREHPVRFTHQVHGQVCYRCHVPLIDHSLHPFTLSPQDCPNSDMVLPLLWTIYNNEASLQRLQDTHQVQLNSLKDYSSWLSGPPVSGHLNNSMAVLLWFTEREL
ncbi:hypothetical protein Agabi119p4_3276 [Agaricus bisporus var. burnettii]|uniref:DNA 3'-5' helicase n=1 Tax=Agaricus bisporus var. burnettii TaxID=192524 RepID=A0A8H7F6T9_AGABI|nr:hypothetical protein Agabi119p4_3276 [Agaricus bisporus var. burnettii]